MLAARYSSTSSIAVYRTLMSFTKYWLFESESSTSRDERFSSNASEIYLRNMRPRTTCLYSAASMDGQSLSAAAHSVDSRFPCAFFCCLTSLSFLFAMISLLVSMTNSQDNDCFFPCGLCPEKCNLFIPFFQGIELFGASAI